MKRLLFLVPSYASFRKPIKKTFEALGWRVLTFDYRKGDSPIRVLRFTPLVGGREKATEMINKRIIEINEKFNPDIILVIKGESLGKNLFVKLRKNQKNKIVNWFPEHMNHWPLAKKIVSYYDYFLCFEPLIARNLKDKGFNNVYYFPFASEISNIKPAKKIYDVSFVGTYTPERESILAKFKQFDINIWGDPRWLKSGIKNNARGGRVTQDKMKDIISKSKININIHSFFPSEGANLRNFEVTGSTGFLLTDYVKAQEDLFKIGKDIVCYNSPKDIVVKTAYFLDHEKEREAIARQGFIRAIKDHNYKKRIKQMLSIIY